MKHIAIILWLAVLLFAGISFTSCVKDSGFKKTKKFTPVFSTSEQVRASIKSDAAEDVAHPGKLFVMGNYIFLNEAGRGVHIIDNTNPSSPVNKAFIHIPGNGDISVKGNILYADCFTDLMAIDISNPNSVKLKNVVPGIFPDRQYVMGYQVTANSIITDWVAKDTTIDIAVSENNGIWKDGSYYAPVYYSVNDVYFYAFAPNASSSSPSKGVAGSMSRFALMNDYLYAVTFSKLNVVDVRQSPDPKWMKTVDLGNSIETIFPYKNKLFIGASNGMQIYDASDPASPSKLGSFGHVTSCDPVIADDKYAFVTLYSGSTCGGNLNQLHVLDISNLTQPVEIKAYDLVNPKGLSKDGDHLFICEGIDGLKVFNASDVNNIKLIKRIEIPDAVDVIALNNIAIVAASDGLYQCDYSDINNIHIISKITLRKN